MLSLERKVRRENKIRRKKSVVDHSIIKNQLTSQGKLKYISTNIICILVINYLLLSGIEQSRTRMLYTSNMNFFKFFNSEFSSI